VQDAEPTGSGAAGAAWRVAGGLVILASAFLFFVQLGSQGVVSEEVRWAEVAREMRASGDYFHPAVNGRTYYDKPLGSYWLIVVASFAVGTVDETAARLPAGVAGVVGVAAVIALGRRLYDLRTGVYAGAVLATCFGYAFYSRRATADVETVTGVLIAVWQYARHTGRPAGPWVVGLWVWMAVVSLTKGLLGFALPVAVFLVDAARAAWAGRGSRTSDRPTWGRLLDANRWLVNGWTLVAVPLAAAVYLLPFAASAWSSGSEIGLEMVWRENVKRFVSPHNHTGPVYLYLGVVFVLAAPWSAFLPAALVPPRAGAPPGDGLARSYFWAVFVFFTLAASRRSYYLLPVLPAVALLVGRVLVASGDCLSRPARLLRSAGWVGLGAVGGGSVLLLLPPDCWLPAPYDQLPPLPARGWLFAVWAAGVLAAACTAARKRAARLPFAVVSAGVAYALAFGVVLPSLDGQRTRRDFLDRVADDTRAEPDRLGLYHASDAVFDLGRTVAEYATPDQIAESIRAGRLRWVVVPRRRLDELGAVVVVAAETSRPWESAEHHANKLLLVEVTPSHARPEGGRP
jgi:4-amino-4-deoxy-L-arabinose transferase-like glycosyltransferase